MSAPAPPPPAIAVILPDGQEVRGVLHERRQTPDTWMHLIGVPLWSTTESGGVEAVEYRAWVTTAQVRPVDGVTYGSVPTRPLPRPVLPVLADQAPGSKWAWSVQIIPARPGQSRTVVHTADCSMAGDGPDLNLDEALSALRRPGAIACKRCDAAASLTPLV
jgi:hypothetical protein